MTEDEETKRPIIIINRIKKVKKNKHHGGSWKIAYADFVTAMMAFFLLMWLLSLLNKYQLEGVAEYFKTPFKKGYTYDIKDKNRDKNSHTEKFKEKEKEKNKEKEKEKGAAQQAQIKQLEMIKKNMENDLAKNPQLSQFKNQLNFIVTSNGLKIQLKDLENKSMFSTGKADFATYAKPLLNWLGTELNKYSNQAVIIGHTDSAQYDNQIYTNWELSADRANATRRELIKSGMDPKKIIRIIGKGDKDPLLKNTLDPSNRRIEIIILSDEALNKEKQQPTPFPPINVNVNVKGTTPH